MIYSAYLAVENFLARLPASWTLLFARIAVAHVFWASGRTKVEGFALREEAVDLFRYEYQLPLISPELAAPVTAIAEHLFPFLLVIGLLSRLSAAALAVVTLVIQFLVYPDAWWTHHSLWLALLLVIVAVGPGAISLDHLLLRKKRR